METNCYAQQKLWENPQRLNKWREVTAHELKVYFAVCTIMRINSLPSITDYWSADQYIGNMGIQKIMTKIHFEEINCFLHLNDSTVQPQQGKDNYDCLHKVRRILSHFNAKVKEVYNPTKHISVDEGMITVKGRLAFEQYTPAKPVKYAIKVWVAADSLNGFVINHKVYLGEENPWKWPWIWCCN